MISNIDGTQLLFVSFRHGVCASASP
eukprot:COSAG04_NODE_25113_length_312_cov_0.488263_1_plen_25_part_10